MYKRKLLPYDFASTDAAAIHRCFLRAAATSLATTREVEVWPTLAYGVSRVLGRRLLRFFFFLCSFLGRLDASAYSPKPVGRGVW